MRRTLVLLLAVSLATTGCIGSAEATTAAMGPEDVAQANAEDWDPGARLVAVLGVELSDAALSEDEASAGPGPGAGDPGDRSSGNDEGNGTDDADAFDHATRKADEELGDGRAPVWVYRYEAANRSYAVVVDGDGDVLAEETGRADGEHPIEGWEIDSDEAADIVAEHNATWAQADQARSTFYGLGQENATVDPVWALGAFWEDRAPAIFLVNATTGEYLGSHSLTIPSFDFTFDFDGGFGHGFGGGGVPAEEGSFEDTVTVLEPTRTHTFQIEIDGHPELQVEIDLATPPAATLSATVRGPGGELGTLEAGPTQASDRASWDDPAPGTYNVTVELDQGATQDYTFCWRATGTGFGLGDVDDPSGRSSWCAE